jgi:hypothetical protein
VLIEPRTWRQHRPWVFLCVVVLAGATLWYFVAASRRSDWPGGSSPPGFTFGVVGGLIILFELLLWFRKMVRVWRIGPVQVWMRAHIWLGLLCLPLLIYHSGFRLGGALSTVLMVLLLIVVASGVWGLALQQVLPRRMLNELPAETIYSQLDRLADQLVREATQLVQVTCGAKPGEEQPTSNGADPVAAPVLVVGAVRSVGRVQGKVLETRSPAAAVPDSEPMRDFFNLHVAPYLKAGSRIGSPLNNPTQAAALFADLKAKVPPPAHKAVETLAGFCEQRQQLDRQARLHFWLHNWLWVHLPLSLTLFVLMIAHVWVALKYW